ncbi:thiamine transporter ThiT [Clostridium acetireducens DSM 10703]|uniref:Thiamine transporter ThiT n=1 Tax=Clostridium acetireducens DSM 10703 TaxID=1121290 RepID=A0A1E8EVT2_9CLOT|nr:energy-coupled thiamine transporter ThiT [Clostridium acetireducens]OFI01359.1 thiamine transporter ThiT [Clostridium acetireducens DSM 10703]
MNWFNFKFKAPKIGEALTTVFSNPIIYLTLIAILVLILIFVHANKGKLTTKIMLHISMAVALASILKMFRILKMPMGGSVTLGSMIPIIFIAYIYGTRTGCLAGIIFGIVDLILGPEVIHPVQLIIDYILAFGVLGFAGYFKNNISLGALFAIILRFICHVISGVVFFASYAGDQNVWIYSILYNGTYLLPEAIIAMVILFVIPVNRIKTQILRSTY